MYVGCNCSWVALTYTPRLIHRNLHKRLVCVAFAVLEVLEALDDVLNTMAGKKGVTKAWVLANYAKMVLLVDEMIQQGVVEQLDKDLLQYLASHGSVIS